MALIDRVVSSDEDSIVCTASCRSGDAHPLTMADGRLHPVVGGEYGAQAAAIHGAICSGRPTPPGMVALFRHLSWHRSSLFGAVGELRIEATKLYSGATGLAYRFSVGECGETIVSGEVGIILK